MYLESTEQATTSVSIWTNFEFDLSPTSGQWYHISITHVRTATQTEVEKSHHPLYDLLRAHEYLYVYCSPNAFGTCINVQHNNGTQAISVTRATTMYVVDEHCG